MYSLEQKQVVVIGATSGIGHAIATLAQSLGAKLIVTGHREYSPEEIKKLFKEPVRYFNLDIGNEQAVKHFFDNLDSIDHLLTPGSLVETGPFLELTIEKARAGMDSKFWGQYYAARYAALKMHPAGSITFFSGILAQKPVKGSLILSIINNAVEGLAKALAVELAPIRVNALSPGIVDTPRWHAMADEDRKVFYQKMADRLLVKRIGKAQELAQAALFLMEQGFITGEILNVSGGHLLT